MRVLSLLQPWASAVIIGVKTWETRSWTPSDQIRDELYSEGFLIHASKKFTGEQKRKITFTDALVQKLNEKDLPLGMIIGWGRIDRVITTETWLQFHVGKIASKFSIIERQLGDYGPGRFAWEIVEAWPLEENIPFKGKLGWGRYDGAFTIKYPHLKNAEEPQR